jgi:hypothetical protein
MWAQIIVAKTADVSQVACNSLQNGGTLLDRYHAGRGDILDAQGNIVAVNVTGNTILRECYHIEGNETLSEVIVTCGGCARTYGTPPVR